MTKFNYFYIFFIVFLISLLPKILLIIFFPSTITGDQELYLRVAKNIISGCGIAGGPDNDFCNPTSMGAKVPGYPILIALIMLFSDSSYFFVRIFNALLISFSIIYFLFNAKNFVKSKFSIFIIGFILAISPITIAWSRYILTESASISITLLIFAELLQIIQSKKINIIRFSIFIIIATFIRIDLFLLFVPIFITIIISFKLIDGLKKIFIIILIFSIPWNLWFLRNYYHGLQIFPQHQGVEIYRINNDDNDYYFDGFMKWTKTWAFSEYQISATYNPVVKYKYNDIYIDFNKINLDKNTKKNSKELLSKLTNYSGKPIPKEIDDEFKILAQKSIKNNKFNYYLILPLKRIVFQWGNMTNSNGLPIEISNLNHKERIELLNADLKIKTRWILNNLGLATLKIIPNLWRLILLLIFLVSLIFIHKEKKLMVFSLIVFSYFVAKNFFSGYAGFMEVRYLANLIPLLEIICSLCIINFFKQKKIK